MSRSLLQARQDHQVRDSNREKLYFAGHTADGKGSIHLSMNEIYSQQQAATALSLRCLGKRWLKVLWWMW
jgi:hypothetical protein